MTINRQHNIHSSEVFPGPVMGNPVSIMFSFIYSGYNWKVYNMDFSAVTYFNRKIIIFFV